MRKRRHRRNKELHGRARVEAQAAWHECVPLRTSPPLAEAVRAGQRGWGREDRALGGTRGRPGLCTLPGKQESVRGMRHMLGAQQVF